MNEKKYLYKISLFFCDGGRIDLLHESNLDIDLFDKVANDIVAKYFDDIYAISIEKE